MKTFLEFVKEKDVTFAEGIDLADLKVKVYKAIKAKLGDDEGASSPDDVWNQELGIFDDAEDILNDPAIADIIRNHPDHGAIIQDVKSGKITVGALIQKLAGGDEERPEVGQNPAPMA